MKILTLIVTLIIASTSFTLKAENYHIKNKNVLDPSTNLQSAKVTLGYVFEVQPSPKICLTRGKVKCIDQEYLLTLFYIDDFGKVQYHIVTSVHKKSKGSQLIFERY